MGSNRYQPYYTSAVTQIIEPGCAYWPTVQLQEQWMVGGEMFLRPLFVIAASPSRLPQDMPAERVILSPVALGCDFHQFVVHSPTIALTDMVARKFPDFCTRTPPWRNSHVLHAEVRCECPFPRADARLGTLLLIR